MILPEARYIVNTACRLIYGARVLMLEVSKTWKCIPHLLTKYSPKRFC
jgi:hypothetical protein